MKANASPTGIAAFVVSLAVTGAVAVPMTITALDEPSTESQLAAEISTGDSRFPAVTTAETELASPAQATPTSPPDLPTPPPTSDGDQPEPNATAPAEDTPRVADDWEPALTATDPTPIATTTPDDHPTSATPSVTVTPGPTTSPVSSPEELLVLHDGRALRRQRRRAFARPSASASAMRSSELFAGRVRRNLMVPAKQLIFPDHLNVQTLQDR